MEPDSVRPQWHNDLRCRSRFKTASCGQSHQASNIYGSPGALRIDWKIIYFTCLWQCREEDVKASSDLIGCSESIAEFDDIAASGHVRAVLGRIAMHCCRCSRDAKESSARSPEAFQEEPDSSVRHRGGH